MMFDNIRKVIDHRMLNEKLDNLTFKDIGELALKELDELEPLVEIGKALELALDKLVRLSRGSNVIYVHTKDGEVVELVDWYRKEVTKCQD